MRRSLVLRRLPLVMIAPLLVLCAVIFLAPTAKRAVFLGNKADVFIDRGGTMADARVLADADRLFTPSDGRFVNRGVEGGPDAMFWLRIRVPALEARDEGERWVLSVQETRVRTVRLIVIKDGRQQAHDYVAGAVSESNGLVPRYATFNLAAAEISGATAFVKIYTRSSRRAVIWLDPQPHFEAMDHRQTLFFALLFGVQIALFVYLIAQGVALGEASLIALGLLVAFYLTHIVADRAFLESVVWPGAVLASRILSFAMTFASYATWLVFTMLYLRVREWSPVLARLMMAAAVLNGVLAVIAIIEPILDVTYLRPVSAWIGLGSNLLALTAPVLALRRRTSRAVLFLACWLPGVAAIIARLFLDVGPAAAGGLTTVYAVYAGVAGSLLAFSIALSLEVQHRETMLRRLAEDNAARFHGFASASSDAFWETGADGRLTVATGEALRRLGALPGTRLAEELAAFSEIGAGGALAGLDRMHPFRKVLLTRGVYPTRQILEVSGVPVEDDGVPVGMRGTLADVTEREDQRLRDDLNSRLAGIGRLTSSLAHDLNNLLHPIINLSRRVSERLSSDGEGRAYLHTVMEAGERAAGIVGSVLANLRFGQGPDNAMPLRAAIAESIKTLERLVDGRVRLVVVEGSEPGPPVDVSDVYQLLANLVGNAMAAADGPVVVTVTLSRHDDATLRLTVHDNGPGMSAEVAARALEPMFTTRAGEGGSGIGLMIVNGIIDRWAARLGVASTPGEGTAFLIDFPVTIRSIEGIGGNAER